MIDELIAFADAEFILGENNLRSQLEKVEQETGERPQQLDSGGDLPKSLEHVWSWFTKLSSTRNDYQPFSHAEIFAFFRLHEVEPLSVEIEALIRLDRAWVLHKANTRKK